MTMDCEVKKQQVQRWYQNQKNQKKQKNNNNNLPLQQTASKGGLLCELASDYYTALQVSVNTACPF